MSAASAGTPKAWEVIGVLERNPAAHRYRMGRGWQVEAPDLETVGPSWAVVGKPQAVVERSNPLRGQIERTESKRRLTERLRGQDLPDVDLLLAHGGSGPLRAHLGGLRIVYLAPGEPADRLPAGDACRPDDLQHRGFVRRVAEIERFGIGVVGIVSQPVKELIGVIARSRVCHLLLADPELAVARQLGMPLDGDGEGSRHQRVVLVARDGRIETVFGPLSQSDAARSARQVLTWLNATR
jgi:peroxiredoxin